MSDKTKNVHRVRWLCATLCGAIATGSTLGAAGPGLTQDALWDTAAEVGECTPSFSPPTEQLATYADTCSRLAGDLAAMERWNPARDAYEAAAYAYLRAPSLQPSTLDPLIATAEQEWEVADDLYRVAVGLARAGDEAERARSLTRIAVAMTDLGLPNEAEPLLREAIDLAEGSDYVLLQTANAELAFTLVQLGRLEEAQSFYRDAIEDDVAATRPTRRLHTASLGSVPLLSREIDMAELRRLFESRQAAPSRSARWLGFERVLVASYFDSPETDGPNAADTRLAYTDGFRTIRQYEAARHAVERSIETLRLAGGSARDIAERHQTLGDLLVDWVESVKSDREFLVRSSAASADARVSAQVLQTRLAASHQRGQLLLQTEGRLRIEAEATYRRSVDLYRGDQQSNPVSVSDALLALADWLLREDRVHDAEQLFAEASQLQVATFGAGSRETWVTRRRLAFVAERRRAYEAAASLYAQVLTAQRETLPPDDPELIAALVEEAQRHEAAGRLVDAAGLWREVVASRSRTHPAEQLPHGFVMLPGERLTAIMSLGRVLNRMRLFSEAEQLLSPHAQSMGEVLGGLDILADALAGLHRYDEAADHLKRDVAVWESNPITRNVGIRVKLLAQIASIRYAQGRPELGDEALARAQVAVAQERQSDTNVAEAHEAIAVVQHQVGRYETEARSLQAALDIFSATSGSDSEAAARVRAAQIENLLSRARFAEVEARFAELTYRQKAVLRNQLGRLTEAQEMSREDLNAIRAIGRTIDLVEPLNNLGVVLQSRGELQEAEVLLREASDIAASHWGPRHETTGLTLNNLAMVLVQQGHGADAETLLRMALGIQQTLDMSQSPTLAARLRNLGVSVAVQNRQVEAEELMRRALDMRRNTLERTHPGVAQSTADLGELLAREGRNAEAAPLLEETVRLTIETWCAPALVRVEVDWSGEGSDCLGHHALIEATRRLADFNLEERSRPLAAIRLYRHAGEIAVARTRKNYLQDPQARIDFIRYIPIHREFVTSSWAATTATPMP